jgi:hypothetical protein
MSIIQIENTAVQRAHDLGFDVTCHDDGAIEISRPGKGTMIFVDAAELLDELRTGYE